MSQLVTPCRLCYARHSLGQACLPESSLFGQASAPKGQGCASPGDVNGENGCMQIVVRDNNVDQALRALKKKLQREGVYREMKLRRHYEKPSEKRAREKAAAVRRARKLERKRAERDGTK
jgi:small subunit ribosomal protein S21